LDRFELFFPERRQFFIENADLFNNFGTQNIRPFFSRRIGLNAPINFGARVSGRLDKDWRAGMLNVQTGSVENTSPAQNFTTLVLQRRMFSRSNLSMMMINKENFGINDLPVDKRQNFQDFHRNLGLEYNLASANNKWRGKALMVSTLTPNGDKNDLAFAGDLNYSIKRWNVSATIERVGRQFNPEVGFVPRTNYTSGELRFGHLFFPQSSKSILSHGPQIGSTQY
jgi:hypothetical protein